MNTKKLFIFVIIPSAINLILIAMYFSGVHTLQEMVAPHIPWLYGNASREFGILENLENVYLIIMIVLLVYAVINKPRKWEKALMIFLLALTIFVFLEEIDYGLNFYEYIMGIDRQHSVQVRNFHNSGDRTNILKGILNIGMALFFVVAPLALSKKSNPVIRYFLPDRWFIGSLIAMVAISQFAHFLRNSGFGEGGAISKNISEFRELTVYYTLMIYLYYLVYKRRYGAEDAVPHKHHDVREK